MPVVFVHGFGGSMATWTMLWEKIEGPRRRLRYDLRGYGRSKSERPESFGHADDLIRLLDALEIDRYDLVGVSMGGGIAARVAIDDRTRVRSVALISPSLLGWEWSADWTALWTPIVDAARCGRMDLARSMWSAHPLFDGCQEIEAAARAIDDEIAAFAGAQWIGDDAAPVLPDVDRLCSLSVPLLLLSGERDLADLHLIADAIEACAPRVTRHDRPGRGHMLHLEDPAWCAERLRTFWGSLPE